MRLILSPVSWKGSFSGKIVNFVNARPTKA
jgi:hypothetical protein